MPDYSNGKIYEIVCKVTGDKYIGSTTISLSQRLANHKYPKSRCMSKLIIERGDYYINLLENYNCDNKEELLKKEREWYDKINCINKVKPYICYEEIKEQQQKYYEKNKVTLKEKKKIYFQENKEILLEKQKKYNEKEKVAIAEQRKKYKEEKKVAIAQQQKIYKEEKKAIIVE